VAVAGDPFARGVENPGGGVEILPRSVAAGETVTGGSARVGDGAGAPDEDAGARPRDDERAIPEGSWLVTAAESAWEAVSWGAAPVAAPDGMKTESFCTEFSPELERSVPAPHGRLVPR
jgi:hypothetical protein